MERLLNPQNDWVFKQVFGQEKNKKILISFINTMLEGVQEPVEDVEFLKVETDKEVLTLRQSIVDVLCKTNKGERYIVEMQTAYDTAFLQRAMAYASRVYLNQRTNIQKERGDLGGYKTMRPVIFLAVMGNTLFPNKKNYLSHHTFKDNDTGECDIKLMSFSFLELSKVNLRFEELKNDVERWVYFFKNAATISPAELEAILGSGTIFGQAYQTLNRAGYTPEQLLEYERYDMKEDEIQTRIMDAENKVREEMMEKAKAREKEMMEKAKAREKEMEEKARQEKIQAAQNLLKTGVLTIEQVSQVMGIAVDEIRKF